MRHTNGEVKHRKTIHFVHYTWKRSVTPAIELECTWRDHNTTIQSHKVIWTAIQHCGYSTRLEKKPIKLATLAFTGKTGLSSNHYTSLHKNLSKRTPLPPPPVSWVCYPSSPTISRTFKSRTSTSRIDHPARHSLPSTLSTIASPQEVFYGAKTARKSK